MPSRRPRSLSTLPSSSSFLRRWTTSVTSRTTEVRLARYCSSGRPQAPPSTERTFPTGFKPLLRMGHLEPRYQPPQRSEGGYTARSRGRPSNRPATFYETARPKDLDPGRGSCHRNYEGEQDEVFVRQYARRDCALRYYEKGMPSKSLDPGHPARSPSSGHPAKSRPNVLQLQCRSLPSLRWRDAGPPSDGPCCLPSPWRRLMKSANLPQNVDGTADTEQSGSRDASWQGR